MCRLIVAQKKFSVGLKRMWMRTTTNVNTHANTHPQNTQYNNSIHFTPFHVHETQVSIYWAQMSFNDFPCQPL